MVASDWSGYRDLVRDGIDGYLIPSAWASSACHRRQSLWDGNSSRDSELSCIAGALAQLVQLDLAAAEMALLTLLSQPTMARAMGAAAAARARDLFAPEVVMAAHEELFLELEQCRLHRHQLMLIAPDQSVPSLILFVCLLALHHILPLLSKPPLIQLRICRSRFGSSELLFGEFWNNRCQLLSAVA